jgi:hypothetical protein
MAKNFFKTIFNANKDKNTLQKGTKINPTYKLSELVTNNKKNDDSKILQQQQQNVDSYNNILSNYYSQKDMKNSIISNFMEKIDKLNKKFYSSSERLMTSKTIVNKLNDELFLNLFSQIDCYIEEIQRLNKKITVIEDKDNKITIKKLTKELSENKEKIRNYEIKLREKTSNEEKLTKELDYYKKRVIFYTNKINININARIAGRKYTMSKRQLDTNSNINSSILNRASVSNFRSKRRYTQTSKKKVI